MFKAVTHEIAWNIWGTMFLYTEAKQRAGEMEVVRQGLQSHAEEHVLKAKGNEEPLQADKKGRVM